MVDKIEVSEISKEELLKLNKILTYRINLIGKMVKDAIFWSKVDKNDPYISDLKVHSTFKKTIDRFKPIEIESKKEIVEIVVDITEFQKGYEFPDTYKCSNCEEFTIITNLCKHCPGCGNKINWEKWSELESIKMNKERYDRFAKFIKFILISKIKISGCPRCGNHLNRLEGDQDDLRYIDITCNKCNWIIIAFRDEECYDSYIKARM